MVAKADCGRVEHAVNVSLRNVVREISSLPEAEVLKSAPLFEARAVRVKRDVSVSVNTNATCHNGSIYAIPDEAFGREMRLCLRERSFSDEDILRDNFQHINVTLFGHGERKDSVALSSLNLTYVSGYVTNEPFSAANGFVLDGDFAGSVYIGEEVFFADPTADSPDRRRAFSKFDDPQEAPATSKASAEDMRQLRNSLLPALNAFIAKYKVLSAN